jgi:hypothetical protein
MSHLSTAMKVILKGFLPLGVFAFAITLMSTDALAASNSLGTVISNTIASFSTLPGLLAGFSYLCGIVLGFMGIMKLKEHVESPNQVQIWDPIKRFLAGGMFFALPVVLEATYNTVAKGTDVLSSANDFNAGDVSGAGLDAMLVSFIADIWEPLQYLFAGFGYLAGIILILIGISRLLKTEQEGARGPMGLGTIMTFLVAGVLLSLNKILGASVGSLFGGGMTNHAELAYTAGMEDAALGQAHAVIASILAFVAILGWISFIRGFFIMRGVAEGNSQASIMAGVTHIIGGSIAVNLGGFIAAVQNTLGISDYGLVISSLEPYMTSVTFIA